MNAHAQAQRAYSSASIPTRTPRSIEYEVIARVTRRLRKAVEQGRTGFSELAQALHDNGRMWNIFAADVASQANKLPAELKARVIYLAEFTQIHTRKVLAGEATVDALLDINTAVMRGLRGEGA